MEYTGLAQETAGQSGSKGPHGPARLFMGGGEVRPGPQFTAAIKQAG